VFFRPDVGSDDLSPGRDKGRPWHITVGAETLVGFSVFAATGLVIFTLWLNPERAWLHPELVAIGVQVASRPRNLSSLFGLMVDWNQISGDMLRARPVTGFFEVIDAWVRPNIARYFAHPAIGITTILYVAMVPTYLFRTLRLFAFSTGQALLFCALLIATPGFLSNLFAYIHMGKPLSFILVSATLFYLVQYSIEKSPRQLVILFVIMFWGMVTDEFMLWNVVFVPAALLFLGALRSTRLVIFGLVAVAAAFAITLLILPLIYGTFGSYGKVPPALLPEGKSHPIVLLLSYLIEPQFYLTAANITMRSLLVNLAGTASTRGDLITVATLATLLGFIVLAVSIRHRYRPEWILGALALFGLCSFGPFGTWLTWFNGPSALSNFAAYTFYYSSPVAYFVVLCLAAVFRAMVTLFDQPAGRRAPVVAVAMAFILGTMIARDVTLFCKLNDVIRFVHIGPTDTTTFFNAVSEGYDTPTPPLIVVTGDRKRFNRLFQRAASAGGEIFGGHHPHHVKAAYYDPAYYDDMPWYGPSFATFGKRYGSAMCIAYYGTAPCPVIFSEAAPQ
jgi:hypothetical protein